MIKKILFTIASEMPKPGINPTKDVQVLSVENYMLLKKHV